MESDCKIEIDPIEKGGQHVGPRLTNLTLTHKPTGISITIPPMFRSQHRQKTAALEALAGVLTSDVMRHADVEPKGVE